MPAQVARRKIHSYIKKDALPVPTAGTRNAVDFVFTDVYEPCPCFCDGVCILKMNFVIIVGLIIPEESDFCGQHQEYF